MKELRNLLPYILKYKSRLIWGLLFVTISNICSTNAPKFVGKSIDHIQQFTFTNQEILTNIGFLILLTLGSGLFMFLTRRTIIVSSRLVEFDLREAYIRAVEKQSMSFFHTHPTGTLMSYVSNDIAAAREFMGPAIMYAANAITTFSFALYFMINLNPLITLFALIPLPFIGISTYFLGHKIHNAFKGVQEEFSKLTTQAQETFSGIRVIKSYNREEFENQEFILKSKEYYKKNIIQTRLQALMMPVFIILIGFSHLIVLGYGGYLVINHQATMGQLTQFFIYLNLLIWPVAAIGWVTNLVQRAAASAGRLWKIINFEPEIIDNAKGNSFKINDGNIKFDKVGLTYKNQTNKALNNINLEIGKGQSLGILGGIGSGKSSLINLIPRLYDITEGILSIDGKNIQEISFDSLREAVGFVPQDTFLFSLTIMENIKFGKPDATEEEIIRASQMAELHNEVLQFPDKYDTILGERGISLSGGQKQRLALARAILKNPKILILDDALAAIDAITEERILKTLREFMTGRTTILISHRISTLKEADQIISLENGEITEKGTHNELLKAGGKYARIAELQEIESELENL
jgi:ATP-binding cassette subfamily B protein